ncbi:hypothetical protein MGN70_001234 [Eutypa lata]|nr:hypothetical protein MGN70_001234 [Eutypa lata]
MGTAGGSRSSWTEQSTGSGYGGLQGAEVYSVAFLYTQCREIEDLAPEAHNWAPTSAPTVFQARKHWIRQTETGSHEAAESVFDIAHRVECRKKAFKAILKTTPVAASLHAKDTGDPPSGGPPATSWRGMGGFGYAPRTKTVNTSSTSTGTSSIFQSRPTYSISCWALDVAAQASRIRLSPFGNKLLLDKDRDYTVKETSAFWLVIPGIIPE